MVILGGGAVSYERGTPVAAPEAGRARLVGSSLKEREFFIDNLLVRIHFVIVIKRCTWNLNSLPLHRYHLVGPKSAPCAPTP